MNITNFWPLTWQRCGQSTGHVGESKLLIERDGLVQGTQRDPRLSMDAIGWCQTTSTHRLCPEKIGDDPQFMVTLVEIWVSQPADFDFALLRLKKRAAGPLGINLCNKLQQTWASNVHVMRSTAIMVSVCLKIMYNPSQILWFINVYHIPWHGHMICPIFSLFSGTKVQLDETSAELPSTGRTWQQWALLKRPLHEVLAVAFPTTPGWDQEVGCSQ